VRHLQRRLPHVLPRPTPQENPKSRVVLWEVYESVKKEEEETTEGEEIGEAKAGREASIEREGAKEAATGAKGGRGEDCNGSDQDLAGGVVGGEHDHPRHP
jgi:hypothetical protein